MKFEIPNSIIMHAIDCDILTNHGGVGSIESRAKEVERKQHYIGEMVTSIIVKEWRHKEKRLPR